MVKHDLREMGYSVHERYTKKHIVNLLWLMFAFLIIIGTIALGMAVLKGLPRDNTGIMDYDVTGIGITAPIPVYFLGLIFFVFFWLGLKFVFTFLFCSDRLNSIKLKTLDGFGLPVCYCREGLKVWQIAASYIAPGFITYMSMFILGLATGDVPFRSIDIGWMAMLFLMSYFFAWDLTLVVYVIAIKFKDKIDYVAINRHIYEITLYRSTYIRLGKRASKKRVEAARQKRHTRVFTKMTTCANINCANYSQDLGEKTKKCELCGKNTHIAEVFTNVITCVNEECENFGQELKSDLTECSNCGEELKNLAFKFRPDLTKPTIIATAVITLVFILLRWSMYDYGMIGGPLFSIINLAQYAVFAAVIIRSWVSKSKWALLTAAAAFLFVNFGLDYIFW